MEDLIFLEEQHVSPELIDGVRRFREQYPVAEEAADRIVRPMITFYGKDILEMAIAALLKGENILLTGPKATGKNILAETLAYIFNRPAYNVSFHVNTSSAELIGTDTFEDNQVKLRRGASTSVPNTADSASWTRSTWRKTTRCRSCMPHWTTAGASTCPATIRSTCTRRPGSSVR